MASEKTPASAAATGLGEEKVSISQLILSRLDDIQHGLDVLRQDVKQDIGSLRQEMNALRQETNQDINGLRQEMSALRQEVQKDLVGLRQEVKQDINSLRQETNQDSNSLRQEVSALRYWSWGSIIAVVVGTVTVILTLKP